MDNFDDLNNYKILKVLNNRNSVFLAENILDGRYYVKKYVETVNIPVYEIMLSERHPCIVSPEKLFYTAPNAVIIEEYIEGICLEELLDNGKIFSLADTQKIAVQICDGLEHLHNLNIIHRDISPSNIILKDDGRIKIIDLGISRIIKKNENSDTQILGTNGFAAPEQFGFKQTDERSDIYSLGVLINLMLTGKLPRNKIYDEKESVKRLILKCIELDPSKRFKNVKSLKKALYKIPKINDHSFFLLPGYRTRNILKMLTATIIYFIWILGMISTLSMFISFSYADITDNMDNFLTGKKMFLFFNGCILVPFLLVSNYVYFTERIPIIKNLPEHLKIFIRFVLSIFVLIVSFVLAFF